MLSTKAILNQLKKPGKLFILNTARRKGDCCRLPSDRLCMQRAGGLFARTCDQKVNYAIMAGGAYPYLSSW